MAKTTSEKIAVMQAFLDGKEIESLPRIGGTGKWVAWPEPKWDWDCCDYRVKPGTREWWCLFPSPFNQFGSREAAEAFRDRPNSFFGGEVIHVREVLEEGELT
jgi:hypothetical protein